MDERLQLLYHTYLYDGTFDSYLSYYRGCQRAGVEPKCADTLVEDQLFEYLINDFTHNLTQLTALIARRIRSKSTGRNHECFPVYSFGGRNADLEPEGCTGIKEIEVSYDPTHGRFVTISVGGHKTFELEPDLEGNEGYQDAAWSIGYPSYRAGIPEDSGGEELTVNFSDGLSVDVEPTLEETADAIIHEAEDRCEIFNIDMMGCATEFDQLSNQYTPTWIQADPDECEGCAAGEDWSELGVAPLLCDECGAQWDTL